MEEMLDQFLAAIDHCVKRAGITVLKRRRMEMALQMYERLMVEVVLRKADPAPQISVQWPGESEAKPFPPFGDFHP